MKLDVEAAAHLAHEAVRALAIEAGQSHVPLAWEKAMDWEKDQAITEVVEILETPDPRERWARQRRLRQGAGWRYGPELNGREKTDPRLAETYEAQGDYLLQRDAVVAAVVETLLPWLR